MSDELDELWFRWRLPFRPEPLPALLVSASLLYLVSGFLPWHALCFVRPVEFGAGDVLELIEIFSGGRCFDFTLWVDPLGRALGLAALSLLAWEGLALARVHLGSRAALVSAFLGGVLFVLTAARIVYAIVDAQGHFDAEVGVWVGLGLSLVTAGGAATRLVEQRRLVTED